MPNEDDEQELALAAFEARPQSHFLTGSAGTGKSHLLNLMYQSQVAKRGQLHVYSTALTGVAASGNVGCTTLHSFAGIQTGNGTVDELVEAVSENRRAMRRWRNCQVLFVDEVSMLAVDLLEKLEHVARVIRNSTKVFGGIVVVFVGDFYQTPPVRGRHYCFQSEVWDRIVQQRHVELKQAHRTKDAKLAAFLAGVRVGVMDRAVVEAATAIEQGGVLPTTLFARNVDVDALNLARLEQLPGRRVEFASMDYGSVADGGGSGNRVAKVVALAVGAQVMLTKNMPALGLVNGSRGVVVGFATKEEQEEEDGVSSEAYARINPDELLPVVQFLARSTPVLVERYEFAAFDGSEKLSSRLAIPLRLAWAMTIHKSQSQTIDLLEVDLTGVFEYGQVFVALSRASSLAGLSVTGYSPNTKLCSPEVAKFYASFKPAPPSPADSQCQEEDEDACWLAAKPRKKLRI
ncbi:hypothetical protein BASA81_000930 [Batrachochytrium salamandrivorans]|nr:hypothetical protein BASA81_000930 [Batrachochytrium salamandrivorans]